MSAVVHVPLAAGNAREAARERMLLEAMRKANAVTVSDLPETTILEVVRWQP